MSEATPDLPEVTLVVVIAAIVLLVGTAAMAPLAGNDTSQEVKTAALLDAPGTWVQLDDDRGVSETVYNSRGYAINLTGASDSYVASTSGVDIASDENWTVSLWARVDRSATATNMTALQIGSSLVITYNRSTDQWTAWHYDSGDRDSYSVSVSDSTQPATWSNIIVRRTASTLTIYHNATAGESVSVTGDSITDAPVDANNWDGRLEEVRAFDSALNASERSGLVNSPLEPRPGTNRTGRIMFDEPYKETQLFLFTGSGITTSNATFDAGFEGESLTPADALFGQADYVWRANGPQIRPADSGVLEHAPVAYVDYHHESAVGSFADEWTQTMEFAGVALVVFVMVFIAGYLQSLRSER